MYVEAIKYSVVDFVSSHETSKRWSDPKAESKLLEACHYCELSIAYRSLEYLAEVLNTAAASHKHIAS